MEGQEIRGLFEAYSKVYETTEVLNEEVVEEDVEQLMERGAPTDPKAKAAYNANVAKNRAALGNTLLYGNAEGRRPQTRQTPNRRGGGTNKPAAAKPATPPAKPATPPAKPATPSAKPAAPAAKPAARPAAKPTAAPSATKPAPGTKAAGPESIKPKTPNPLMKDMPGATLKKAQEAPKPQMSARAQALKAGGPKGGARERMLNQGVDIFDLIKGHLLDEGYAETEENAIVMMANMSEEWRKSILEAHGVEILDEAQAARENPEKHEEDEEKENEKKYGKVRGEKTPMPPRGDKRREDFEKWYAKQMGR